MTTPVTSDILRDSSHGEGDPGSKVHFAELRGTLLSNPVDPGIIPFLTAICI